MTIGLPTQSELDAAFLAGAWVAEGFASPRRVGFNNTDRAYFDAVVDAFDRVVGGPRYVTPADLPSGKTLHELDVQDTEAWSHSDSAALTGLKSADKRIPEFVWHAGLDVKQAFLQALFEGDGCVSYLARTRCRSPTPRAASSSRVTCRTCCSSSASICRRAEYANGEIKLVIGNRRDANLFARGVGFWGAKQEKLEQILDALPGALSTNDVDRIPFLAEYVRAESGARGADKKWLEKHSFDRTADWERRGHEILAHIPSAEVKQVIAPLVVERLVLRHRRVGHRRRRAARVLRSGSTPTTTPSSPPGSSTTTPSRSWRRWRCSCWARSTRTPSTSRPPTTATPSSRSCSRRDFPTSWSTEEAGSPSVWRRTSRRTTSGR